MKKNLILKKEFLITDNQYYTVISHKLREIVFI